MERLICLLVTVVLILFSMSACDNTNIDNKKNTTLYKQTTGVWRKTNLENKIPVLFDTDVHFADNYAKFEKIKGNPIEKVSVFEVADQRMYKYNENILGIGCKVIYTFGGDILQEAEYNIHVKSEKEKQDVVLKVKEKLTNIYNISNDDFKKETKTEYSFRKFIIDQSGVDGLVIKKKNSVMVLVRALNASGVYYDTVE